MSECRIVDCLLDCIWQIWQYICRQFIIGQATIRLVSDKYFRPELTWPFTISKKSFSKLTTSIPLLPEVVIPGAEKCLKEIRTTWWICFVNAILMQSITSNLHQKCSFEHFKRHQNYNLTSDYSSKFSVLVYFEMFEWALLVQIQSNTLHQNCICGAIPQLVLKSFHHFLHQNKYPG